MRLKHIVTLLIVLMAGCQGPPGDSLVTENTVTDLQKSVYQVQANETGELEFEIPGLDNERGVPMVQVYAVNYGWPQDGAENNEDSEAGPKFRYFWFETVPHTLDTTGTVRATLEPNQNTVIIVVD